MTITRFLDVLRARWRLALTVLATVITLTLVISLLLPHQYKATASVLVDMRSPDPLAGPVLNSVLNTGYMATQMDLVQSDRVARRVISLLDLSHDSGWQQAWQEATGGQGEFESWVSEQMVRKLDIQPTRESGVMSITFTALDPVRAASTANAFMQAYIDTTLELRVEPAKQYTDFFDSRAKLLRKALDDAQDKLSAYQQANGIVATDERLDVENMRFAELSSQLVSLQALSAESDSRAQQAHVNVDKMPEVVSNPAVAALNNELSRQQVRRDELREKLGDQHPQVVEIDKSLEGLRTQLAAAQNRVSAGMGLNSQINRTREAQLRSLLDQQRAKVLRLKSQRDEATVLQRDVDSARLAYDAVQQHARQTGLESHMTQTNVSVLRQATPPVLAASPKLWSNLTVALVLGTLLSMVAVLAREINDRRMRTADDVVEGLRQPLLVTLPRHGGQTRQGALVTGFAKTRILGGLSS